MGVKTLVLQVKMDKPTEEVLSAYGDTCSRWMNKTFRRLYSDKRHSGSKLYGGLVHNAKKGFKLDDSAIYRLLVSEKDAPNPIPIAIAHKKNLQALATKVIVIWGGFLGPSTGRAVPRPKKGHLPHFKPVCCFQSQMARLESDNMTISVPYPLSYGRKKGEANRINMTLVPSSNKKYRERLDAFRRRMHKQQKDGRLTTPSIDVRYRDGKWYLHVPVTDDRPKVNPIGMTMGIDLGERNSATTVIVSGEKGQTVEATKIYSGLKARHTLDLISVRKSKLDSMSKKRTGSRGARVALKRLRGKMTRVNDTLTQQASAAIVKNAVAAGVGLIAMEDLRGGFRKIGSRAWNHRISRWPRGMVRDDITYKAEAAGIKVREVYARGTSSLCPNCHPTGWLAIGEKKHGKRARGSHVFQCKTCGYSGNDDVTGAINIARRGLNPRWAYHNPLSGALPNGDNKECKENGSGILAGSGGDTCQPQKPCEKKGAVTSNGAFLNPRMKETTGTGGDGSTEQSPATSLWTTRFRARESAQTTNQCGYTVASNDTTTPHRGTARTDSKTPKPGVTEEAVLPQKQTCSKMAIFLGEDFPLRPQWVDAWTDMAGWA